jgi:serine protease AprX
MRPRARIRRTAVALVAAGLMIVPTATATPATLDLKREVSLPDEVVVSPGLVGKLAAGPATAILSWDEDVVARSVVERYLAATGLAYFTFDASAVAVGCLGGLSELATFASVPGAISVYPNEPLTLALDKSVRTVFNGSPTDVWNGQGIDGSGVGIAVLDTGIDATHPDLEFDTRVKQNVRVLISHREFLSPGGDPPPCQDFYATELEDSEISSGHGTHMASVAAGDGTASDGRYKGVAPGADIIGVAMSDSTNPYVDGPGGNRPTTLAAIGAINYLINQAMPFEPETIKVALMGWTDDGIYDPWSPLEVEIKNLTDYGVTPVLPIGNRGPEVSDCSAAETCYVNRYGVGPYVIGVGATPKTSRTSLARFSSRGDPEPRQVRDLIVRHEPFVVAPGDEVVAARRPGLSPYATLPYSYSGGHGTARVRGLPTDDYVSLSGTSVAAAHVAGVVALMQQAAVEAKGCYLTVEQVRDALQSTATPVPGHGS